MLVNHIDFSNISIPDANLSGAIYESTNFQNSDLSNVNFRESHLRNANFQNSNLNNIKFFQYPSLLGHTYWVTSVCYSPNGQQIVSGSWDKSIRIWDVTNGQLIHTLNGHTHYVTSVCYSPNGQQIVSGSADNSIRIWDASNGQLIGNFKSKEEASKSGFDFIEKMEWKQCEKQRNENSSRSNSVSFQLKWYIGPHKLELEGANINKALNLSLTNLKIMKQLGSIGDPTQETIKSIDRKEEH